MAEEMTYKEKTRARILDEAARAMRERGPDGIGVAALMNRAGLTHGGFYAHFTNRDDLVAHAVDRMFQDSRSLLYRHLDEGDPAKGLNALIDAYLSDEARQALDQACPIPGLSGEAQRMPGAARQRFGKGVQAFHDAVEGSLKAMNIKDPCETTWSIFAEMVGAMALARAVPDEEAARHILCAARGQLKRRLGLDGRLTASSHRSGGST